jgi:hypothetical protein
MVHHGTAQSAVKIHCWRHRRLTTSSTTISFFVKRVVPAFVRPRDLSDFRLFSHRSAAEPQRQTAEPGLPDFSWSKYTKWKNYAK